MEGPIFRKFFYFLIDSAEIFSVYAFFPEVLSWFRRFLWVPNGLQGIWGQSSKKIFYSGVKPLVHMSWKFTWTILAPIYSNQIRPIFDITSKKKVMISQIFFWKKFLPFRRKKLFKKNPRIQFLWFLDIV